MECAADGSDNALQQGERREWVERGGSQPAGASAFLWDGRYSQRQQVEGVMHARVKAGISCALDGEVIFVAAVQIPRRRKGWHDTWLGTSSLTGYRCKAGSDQII